MRRTKRIIASLVAAVTVISQVMPMMKVTAATDNVRLATFNIAANKKPDITKLNELLKTNNVDIVGLQEVDINTSRNPYNMLEKFVEQGDYAYSSFQKAIETGGGDYGVALLSNLELINTNGGALSSEGIKEARAWQKGEIEVNGKVIAVYNTHLTYESVEARAKQLLELKATMDQDPAEYKVAFGDFNVDQNHNEIYPFLEDYNIANGKGGKWYDTFNGTDASMKTSAVDNIITSRNLEISNITMVETDLSDHNLFYADAKLLDQPVASRDYLDLVISDANALDEGKYSNASYNTLDEKLVAGELLDQNATQEQINKAVKDIQTAQDNLKTRYPNLALNKDVSVSGLEVNDGRWTAPMAVDGIVSSDSRVSLAKDKDEQWLEVDLGKTETISNFVINYESQVPAFKIQVAGEDKVYRDIYEVSNLEGQISNIQKISIDPTEARYVKYVQLKRWTHSGNGKQYSGSIYEFEVYEQDPDAKDYSNIALNRPVSASSLEVGDGRFTAPMAVDGVVSKDSRVSFGKTADNQWLLVDLGSRKTVSEFVINYESCPPAFKIQVSTDGVNYQDVYEAADLPDGGPSEIKEIQIEATKARYVKYVQLKRWTHTNKNKYSGSIYEFEVYKERDHTVTTADEVLKSLNKEAPQINGNKIVLPAVPDGFEISLYGCDNKQVVAMDGTITRPLEDMDINVLYQVKNLNDETDIAYSEADINFIVPGAYNKEESINAKPNVMPGLREWKGNEGEFTLSKNSKIVVKNASLEATAKQIQFYLKEMIKHELEIVTSGEKSGDIVLVKDGSVDNLGKEGYTLAIDDMIEIKSNYETGILYGGISITQMFSQNDGMNNVAKGLARDYPKYEVRAGMLDVARTYIPMEYLQEMTIYMAYYKLNEVQVHVNDYWGATGYSAFRLECDTYPMITATDGSYTKEEYRQYQIDMKNYGINVITEIDTPYHAECFRNVPGVKMLKAGALDIREQSSYDVIEAVLDEYLDGPNPVIQSDKFHIGTDEYDKSYSEQMRKWTDHFINYVNDKGYDTRLWGSLGSRGFNGTTPVSNDATVNLWAPYWADVKETYNAGYDIINTCGGWLYIVPGANAGYPDRLDIASLYDKFDVNNFSPSRNAGQGTAIMPIAHPQTKGGQFCVWNDMTSYGGGFTWFDIYDRFIDAVMITSEKTWYGEKTDGQTAAEFVERANKLNSVVPGANPGRVVESKGENITAIDFETIKNGKAVDTSGNNYNATLNNAIIEKANGNNIATVNGDGYVALPYKSIGYPYTVMMDIKLDSNTSENTEIFSGDDGVMYANIDGTGKIGYSRSGYNFTFDYELPKDTWVNLALTCDQKNTTLYINGKAITTGINMGTAINNRKDSSTFVLPVEKILNNAKGSVDNIKIYNKTFSATEISDELGYIQLENLALNKNATASSVNPLTPNLTPNLAVDGDNTKVTTNRWSSKRATGAGTNEGDTEYGTVEQDLTVDLGANYKVDKVFISWEGAYATKYTIQGSLDGVNFFDIKDITNGTGGEITHKDLGDVETRYVRIACHDAKNRNWGYSIYELEVYQSTNEGLRALVKEGQAELAKFDAGNKNGNIAKDDYEVFEQKFEDYLALADGTEISTEEIGKLLKEVTAIINSIEDSVIYSKNELNELYQKVSLYQEKDFTKDSFVDFNTKLTAIKGLIDNADDYIKVNEAMGQLQTLDSSLVKLDRSKLKTAIESYDNFQETDYTTSSWQTMKTIVDAAKLVHENVSLNQVDVDNAIAALNEINLEKRGNTKELAKLLKEYDEADYTISTWAEFAGVYQAANAMVVDNSDVNQEQVDAMVALVREVAMKLLELGNSKDLEKVINKITEAIKDLDQANYNQDSWNKLQTMIKAAKELLDSKDVSQAELDAMLDSLNQVYDALKPIEVKPGEETETPTNKPVTDTSDKSVKTGDDVNLFGYAGLLGIALMGLICRKKFD